MTKFKKLSQDLEVTEKPISLRAWSSQDSQSGLKVIEQDIRTLMRQVAEARFALAVKEKETSDKTRGLLLSVLEVNDAFDRVFQNIHTKPDMVTPQMKIWIGNFRAVRLLAEKLVREQGVVKIENLDAGFDPRWHKVAGVVADLTKPEGAILEEVQKGYMWQNQVLRKSEVIVVRHSERERDVPGD